MPANHLSRVFVRIGLAAIAFAQAVLCIGVPSSSSATQAAGNRGSQIDAAVPVELPGRIDEAGAHSYLAGQDRKRGGTEKVGSGPVRDQRMRGLMDQLGIQVKERAGEQGYLERGAPAQDRYRLGAARLVHPPDAYHSGNTAAPGIANDPNRLKPRGRHLAGGGSRGALSALYNFNERVRPEGRFGYRYSIDNAEGDLVHNAINPSDLARRSTTTNMLPALRVYSPGSMYGRSSFGYGASPSSLFQPGSPSSPFSQFGGPSSTTTIGLGAPSHLSGGLHSSVHLGHHR